MKPAILLLNFFLLISAARAQNITDGKQVVPDFTSLNSKNNSTDLPFFNSSSDAEKILTSIMDALGLEDNFKIRTAKVPNVEATIRHQELYILYNPDFVNKVNAATKDKWASIFILAHEVGHHLEGHTLADAAGSPTIELEADQFAGFTLCKMGATLDEAQLAMHYIANTEASKTHPGRADRLLAIEKGWDKASVQMKAIAYNPNPLPSQNGVSQN